jgi:hypothetical protein
MLLLFLELRAQNKDGRSTVPRDADARSRRVQIGGPPMSFHGPAVSLTNLGKISGYRRRKTVHTARRCIDWRIGGIRIGYPGIIQRRMPSREKLLESDLRPHKHKQEGGHPQHKD